MLQVALYLLIQARKTKAWVKSITAKKIKIMPTQINIAGLIPFGFKLGVKDAQICKVPYNVKNKHPRPTIMNIHTQKHRREQQKKVGDWSLLILCSWLLHTKMKVKTVQIRVKGRAKSEVRIRMILQFFNSLVSGP